MSAPLALFEGYGIEIELILVATGSLDVRPVVDELLRVGSGTDDWVEDVDDGPIGWSNELVGHCVELKTNGPVPSYAGLAQAFDRSMERMARIANSFDAVLLPTAMHPWMDPSRETSLWSHDHGPVYRAYDRLFDCRGHGWSNVQSVHVNLPFAGDSEFGRLMAAARAVLPLIPGLAAASPIVEGRATGLLNNRLEYYRTNALSVPAMTAGVVPEPVYDISEYKAVVLGSVERDLRAVGADEVLLGEEWTNARGAIARFDRMAIEIRLIDSQECMRANLAMALAVSCVVRALVEERWSTAARTRALSSAALRTLLADAVRSGPEALIGDADLLATFGQTAPLTLGRLWESLIADAVQGPSELMESLEVVLAQGTLAQRILNALGPDFEKPELISTYRDLAGCLADDRMFAGRA